MRDNYSVWIYNIPSLTYGIPMPWVSGMAQGVGIQTLLLAYNLTKDDKYMITAESALKSFNKEVKLGGVTFKDKEGWWYGEYACHNWNKEPRVLNGFIFALLGINDYYKATGDENAKRLFDLGFSDLKSHLADFDTGSWTNYDSLGLRASRDYHHIHVTILGILYDITGDSEIKMYRDKWKGYESRQGYGANISSREIEKEIPLLQIYPMIQ
jgi:hypothetical protein